MSDFLWSLIFFSTLLTVYYADMIFTLNITINLQSVIFSFILILDLIMLKAMAVESNEINQKATELNSENTSLKRSLEIKREFIKERNSTKMQINLKFKGSIYHDFYENKESKNLPELKPELNNIKKRFQKNKYDDSKIIIYSTVYENNLQLLEDFSILSDYIFSKVKTEEDSYKE